MRDEKFGKWAFLLAIGLVAFAVGLDFGSRIEHAPLRTRLVSHDSNYPVQVIPPSDWYETTQPQGQGSKFLPVCGFAADLPCSQMQVASFQAPVPTPAPTPAPTSPITPTLWITIAELAALTVTFLNGIKSALPQIGGWGARAMAVLIAAFGAIAVAPAGQSAIVTGGTALTAALSAMGVHDYLTGQAGGTPPAAPPAVPAAK